MADTNLGGAERQTPARRRRWPVLTRQHLRAFVMIWIAAVILVALARLFGLTWGDAALVGRTVVIAAFGGFCFAETVIFSALQRRGTDTGFLRTPLGPEANVVFQIFLAIFVASTLV